MHQQVDLVPAALVVAELEVRPGAERVAGRQQRLDQVQALGLVGELGRRDLSPALRSFGHDVTSPSTDAEPYLPTIVIHPARSGRQAPQRSEAATPATKVQSVALVELRRFLVEDDFEDIGPPIAHFVSQNPLQVDLAALLHANAMTQDDVEDRLRYRILQYELRIILSYLACTTPDDWLKTRCRELPRHSRA